jgi:pimeloyl-ACP methyl ester carboxylesterase
MQADFSLPTPGAAGTTPQGTAWSRYGSGAPVVLVHGVGMGQAAWAPQVRDLARDFDVLVYDMWGHGKSTLPGGPLDLNDYAQQLVDLLDHLGLPSVHVIGHSMGASVALEFALGFPSRCKGVVAMNAVFSRTHQQSRAVEQRAEELLTHSSQGNVDDTMRRWFGDPMNPQYCEAEHLSRKLLAEVNPVGYARAYKVFATADLQHVSRLPVLEVPVLFFTGALDPNSTPAMSQAMSEIAPHGQVHVLVGQRHMMSFTVPEQVNRILRRALTTAWTKPP